MCANQCELSSDGRRLCVDAFSSLSEGSYMIL